MYKPGDLVQVNLDCSIKYYWGMTALVIQNMGQDATDHANGNYYQIQFNDGTQQIFNDKEINLLSKAVKK